MSSLKKIRLKIAVIVLILVVGFIFTHYASANGIVIKNPYKNYSYWYKGQTHCHSNTREGGSDPDGKQSKYDVERAYRDKGYDFVCLTDHDQITKDPNIDGILHIPSEEDGNGEPVGTERHLIGIDITSMSDADDWPHQVRIDHYINQGGLAILCHPNCDLHLPWYKGENGWKPNKSRSLMLSLKRYTGIEIFSNQSWDITKANIDDWDFFASIGKKVWGFASDDCHNVKDPSGFNKGWIVVNSNRFPIDKEDIIQNIKAGNFYAVVRGRRYGTELKQPDKNGPNDIGPELIITVEENTISVKTDVSSNIRFIGNIGKTPGRILKRTTTGMTAKYTCTGTEDYVRIEVEQIRPDGEIYTAYSQPLFIYHLEIASADDLLAKDQVIVGHNVIVKGNLHGGTPNKAVVDTNTFGMRQLYADESTEVFFFDRGKAQLKDGQVTVYLDPMFLETVTIDDNNPMRVRLTLTDDCKGIYVSKKTANSFTVKEIDGGQSNATFNWEVAAKRRGFEDRRLEEIRTSKDK